MIHMNTEKETGSIHILLVEDNARYLREIESWLKDFGYQHIVSVCSAAEAKEQLQHPFDVIVADMRMEQDDSGFGIIDEVRERNLSSVVIILTANDTVADCRRAFKSNAWDYISKNMKGNPLEAVHQSIQEAIAYFNRWGNIQNEQWIEEYMPLLQEQYNGQYIAVINRTVIESADTLALLEQRISERKLRRFLTTIKKIGDVPSVIEFIRQGESFTLEFKSTLQWDVREERKNKDLQFSVLKTIAAFLNSEGGTLLIGVEDNGSIFGLEQDLALLSKGSLDQFQLTLIQLIKDRIGVRFTSFITIRFEQVEQKDVCIVSVQKASRPAVLRDKDKEQFYIRCGNQSQPLKLDEVVEYMLSQQGITERDMAE